MNNMKIRDISDVIFNGFDSWSFREKFGEDSFNINIKWLSDNIIEIDTGEQVFQIFITKVNKED
jgi:hypothetical protein